MNPIYKLVLWSQEKMSNPCKKGGKKPTWNQNFVFQRKKAANILRIEVWDEGKYEEKDLIGSCWISLDNLNFMKREKFSEWIEISYDNKKSGKVFVNFVISKD